MKINITEPISIVPEASFSNAGLVGIARIGDERSDLIRRESKALVRIS